MIKKIILLFTLLTLPLYAFQAKDVKKIAINNTKILNFDQNKQNLLDRAFSGALTDLARLNSNAKRTFTVKTVGRNKVLQAYNQGVVMTSARFANEVDANLVIERSMTEILEGVYKFKISLIDISNLNNENTVYGIFSAKGVSQSEKNRSLRLEILNQMVTLFNGSFPMENPLDKKMMSDSALKKLGNPPTATKLTESIKRNKTVSITIPTDQDNIIFALTTKPKKGKASLKGNKIFYTSNEVFTGTEEFNYLAKNINGLISEGVVEISVSNSAPVANNIDIVIDAGKSKSIDLSKYVYDEDNDRLTYTLIETQKINGQLSPRGSKVMYVSSEDFDGKERISYYVSDDLNAKSNIAKIVISVKSDKKAQAQADAARKAQAQADAARKAQAQADAARKAQADADRKAQSSIQQSVYAEEELDRQQAEEEFARQRAQEDLALQKAEEARRRADRESGLIGWNIEDDSTEDSENISDSSDSEQEDEGMNLTLILGGVLLLVLLAGGGGGGGGGGIATGAVDIGILLP